jgi:hypothetical protein
MGSRSLIERAVSPSTHRRRASGGLASTSHRNGRDLEAHLVLIRPARHFAPTLTGER